MALRSSGPRSRSLAAGGKKKGFTPLRHDAPERKAAARGALPALTSEAERSKALVDLEEGFYANSSRKAVAMKWRTIVAACGKFEVSPLPLTKDSIFALGAVLKAGHSRSAESYVSLLRSTAERNGQEIPSDLRRLCGDVVRSCLRGIGGPTKPLALPMARLAELPVGDEPWNLGGPVGPADAIVAGSWFLTREIELSTSRACLVEFAKDDARGAPIVRWYLPASKNDTEARGVARAHGCACAASAACPLHALRRQHDRLQRLFPALWRDGIPDHDLPLFPGLDGRAVTKEAMTETILEAANKLDIATINADQSARISGHSLRMTGAQGLARSGVDVWAIQLLGRWGGSTVLEYVQAVPLERSAAWALRAAREWTLDSAVEEVRSSRVVPAVELVAGLPPEAGVPAAISEALVHESSVGAAPASAGDKYIKAVGTYGKWHRIPPIGVAGPVGDWSTSCGWRFTGTISNMEMTMPLVLPPRMICARCLPDAHSSALAAAV